ncbi:hypothetical protein RKD21_003019 [Streptomyces albogriseolus]|uniref:Uncharacterized protein n=1 Tax=Streptomyces albogriseolus TaxID=1887 RepID=A0ACC6UMW4_STRAO
MDQGEAGRLLGELRRVGLAAHPGRLEGAAARDDEAAGHDLVAGLFHHRVGLTGEQRLVDLQTVRLDDRPVDDDLVPRSDLDEVVQHDLGGADLGGHPVAAHRRPHLADQREGVQRLLRPPLLDDPDAGVGEDHIAEQAVLDRRDDQHDHPEHADDRVEPGEDVRADDLRDRPAAARGYVVDLSARHPLGHFRRGQTGHRRRGRGGPDGIGPVARVEMRHAFDSTCGSCAAPTGAGKIRPGKDSRRTRVLPRAESPQLSTQGVGLA